MPRKKAATGTPQVIVVPAQGQEEEPDDRTPDQVETDAEVERATSELSSRTQAKLFRAHPATGNREAFVDSIPADVFTQDYVRENYGGGRFRVAFHGRRPDGKVGFIKQDRFEIDATIPPKVPGVAITGQAPAPAHSSSIDAAVVGMLTTMMTQIAAQAQASATQQASMANLQMTMMKEHSAAMQAQLAKLGERPPERDTLGEMTKIVTMMKDLNPPGPARSLRDEIETLNLLKELTGESQNETSWLDVIKEYAPVFAAQAKDGVPVRRPVPKVPKATATPILTGEVANVPAPTTEAETPNVNPNIRFVAPIMPRVIKWATQGKDAALCADWLLSDIPVGFYPMLREQLSSPTFIEDIVAAFPAADPFRPWILKLRDSLIESTEPEDDNEPDDEGDDEPE